jgi:hypothetical protein
LWESEVTGLLVKSNKDFIILNRDGMSVIALGKGDKRIFLGNEPQEKMVHCLEQLNYLKIDPENIIEWDETEENNII